MSRRMRRSIEKKLKKAKRALVEISMDEQSLVLCEKLSEYKSAAKALRPAIKEYEAANKAYVKKQSAKNEMRRKAAEDTRYACALNYKSVGDSISASLDKEDALFEELKQYVPAKKYNKLSFRREKGRERYLSKMTKIEDGVNDKIDVAALVSQNSGDKEA